MSTIDWEENRMVEIPHPILTIMTVQACRSIFCLVLCHKINILSGVTVDAGLLVEGLEGVNIGLIDAVVAVATQ